MDSQESKLEERVTYVDLSQYTVGEEDELPDILTDEFPGAQVDENDCITPLFTVNLNLGKEEEVTGAQFTGAQEVTDVRVTGVPLTGTYKFTGAQVTNVTVAGTPVTGALSEINGNFTGAQITGAPDENDVSMRVKEARRRLSLSLRKSKAPDNSSQSNKSKKSSDVRRNEDIEFVESITIESSDLSPDSDNEVEYYAPDDNPGMGPAQYIFIPIGTRARHDLTPLFGINRMGSLPNYSWVMKVCQGRPSKIKDITGDGNCLFNSMSYVLSSSEKFNWQIRQKLCSYIERNWSKVGHLAGCLREYKTGKDYIKKKRK